MSRVVYETVENVYGNCWQSGGKSWQRLNPSLSSTLAACVRAGLEFAADDFERIWKDFKGFYWFGCDKEDCYGEKFYALAVESGNLSACKSFETWKRRKPFTLDGSRIFVGRRFRWQGWQVVCTSFAGDGQSVIACGYDQNLVDVHAARKPTKRFTISHADLKQDRAERKKPKTQAEAA